MFRVLCLTLVLISGVLCEHQLEKRQSVGFNVGGLVDAGVGALKNAQTAISTGINAFAQSISGIANGFINLFNFGGTRAAEFDEESQRRFSFLSEFAKQFGSVATEIAKQVGAGFSQTVAGLSNVASGFIGGQRSAEFFNDKDAQKFRKDLEKATFAFQQITNRFQRNSNNFFNLFNGESGKFRSKAEFDDAAFRAFNQFKNEGFFFADELDKLSDALRTDAPAFVRASGISTLEVKRFNGLSDILKSGASIFRELIQKGVDTFGKFIGGGFRFKREDNAQRFRGFFGGRGQGRGQGRGRRSPSTTVGTTADPNFF